MKTSELTGAALDWAVATLEAQITTAFTCVVAIQDGHIKFFRGDIGLFSGRVSPSTNWAQGGPIIEREKIALDAEMGDVWRARVEYTNDDSLRPQRSEEEGSTPLEAAMRCYVASKLGDEIDIPKELTQ